MFDVGFFELALIGIIALLVVGPQRLPKLAKTAGMWIGRGRRFVGTVKEDIEKELKAEELKKVFEETKAKNPLHEIIEDTKQSFDEIKKDTANAVSGIEKSVEDNEKKLDNADNKAKS